MDRFDTMLAFTRVVELASFTKTAASLNLPKATVSAQVLALEKRLRVKLLNRTTRHVSVTPDGAAYYERAVRLLSELEETEAAVRQATTVPKGRLRVDVPGSVRAGEPVHMTVRLTNKTERVLQLASRAGERTFDVTVLKP